MMVLAAAQAAHVVIDKFRDVLTLTDSRWAIFAAKASAVAAGASALAAIATSVLALVTWNLVSKTAAMSSATKEMAQKTSDLAKETAEQAKESGLAIKQAQRHHEETLMPYLRAIEGIRTVQVSGVTVDTYPKPVLCYNAGSVNLGNKGSGIAIKPTLYLEPPNQPPIEFCNSRTKRSAAIPPIGPGDFVTISEFELRIITDIPYSEEAARQTFKFIIEYHDIFGNLFRTTYEGDESVRFLMLDAVEAESATASC
jgi:hypothetical protein